MRGSSFEKSLRAVAALSILTAAAAGCALDPLTPAVDCSIAGKNERLFDLMNDVYLWSAEVPFVDPSAYASPEALLDELRYKQRDRWSYITTKESNDAYFKQGLQRGLGYRLKYDPDQHLRFAIIRPGSPAAEAGLKRGEEVLAVGGRTIAEIEQEDLWAEVMGQDQEGVEVTFTIEDALGAIKDITLIKRWYSTTTTPIVKVLNAGSKRVGYLLFGAFRELAMDELLSAFATLKANHVDDLILDLRYNGGGSYGVAGRLASLVRGAPAPTAVFSTFYHNEWYSYWDYSSFFEPEVSALGLSRVAIIVTSDTASASEVFINGLRPHMEVSLVGATTHGKPVGMYSWEHCDIVITPITVRAVNADGEGDFYEGLEPDCLADDLLTAELGSETESSIAEALYLLQNGSCSAPSPPGGAAGKLRTPTKEVPLRGLQLEIGSF
jgi:carboxyl-terminal processing protease